jgi:hypothetical protein
MKPKLFQQTQTWQFVANHGVNSLENITFNKKADVTFSIRH